MVKKRVSREHVKRSFVKSITFRLTIIITDTIIVLALKHRYEQAAGFVILTNVASTLIYYLHERAWAYIHWGSRQK